MNKNLSNIKKALKYLNNNECVGIPTETVYGLAGNAYSNKSTSKIFKLKKRPKKNPLIVHYYNLNILKNDCLINSQFLKLYNKFCPGQLHLF
jgi:Putative translation factor (SUA5)